MFFNEIKLKKFTASVNKFICILKILSLRIILSRRQYIRKYYPQLIRKILFIKYTNHELMQTLNRNDENYRGRTFEHIADNKLITYSKVDQEILLSSSILNDKNHALSTYKYLINTYKDEPLSHYKNSDYHLNSLQPIDLELINYCIKFSWLDKKYFALELFCRTLLAQIIYSKFNQCFNHDGYGVSQHAVQSEFVEVIGDCLSQCRLHIQPLNIPLRIIDGAQTNQATFKIHESEILLYKKEFTRDIKRLLKIIAINSDDQCDQIVNEFISYNSSRLISDCI